MAKDRIAYNKNMPNKSASVLLLFILISATGFAQPYLDLAATQHISFKNSGITSKKTNANAEGSWDLIWLNIPLKIDSSNMLLLSPEFEYRAVINDENIHDAFYRTAYLPITYIHTFPSKNRLSLTGIYRYNADTRTSFSNKNDQIGFAGIFYKKQSDRLTWKAGLYFNQEFFNNQWIPFLGIDYHFNNRLMVTCLLPRYLLLDYTFTPSIHGGLWFRGLDESYRSKSDNVSDYYRVTEGYLRAYLDYYIPKTKLVVTAGIGHTLQRKYRYGYAGGVYETFPEGALLFHTGLAMRFITDKNFRTQREP